jgi:hypothetical protein
MRNLTEETARDAHAAGCVALSVLSGSQLIKTASPENVVAVGTLCAGARKWKEVWWTNASGIMWGIASC